MRTKDAPGKTRHKFCASVCISPWKPEQFWHEKEKKTKKSMRFFRTALLVSGFFSFLPSLSICSVLKKNMGWQNIIHISSGTVRYCKEFGKRVGQIMKTVLPVDPVLFNLGHYLKMQWGKTNSTFWLEERGGFFAGRKWNFQLKPQHQTVNESRHDRMLWCTWICRTWEGFGWTRLCFIAMVRKFKKNKTLRWDAVTAGGRVVLFLLGYVFLMQTTA